MALAVFEKQDSDQITVEEIDQVIDRYPYFGVLHYLKAGKLIAEANPGARACSAKAALFFPNPHWFDHLLKQQKESNAEHADSLAEIMTTPHDNALLEAAEEPLQADADLRQVEMEAEYDSKRILDDDSHNEGDIASGSAKPLIEVPIQENAGTTSDEAVSIDEVVEFNENGQHLTAAEFQTSQEDVSVQDLPAETGEQTATPADHSMASAPGPDTEAIIPIEPLYSIDYFASQGIKLPLEEVPGDQLAFKLRSFTEWLKSMKRIQPEKMDTQMDRETEKKIRQTAEHSNDNTDVVTEALAEVYHKQGLDDKAVEVYKKLSLLDPAKSAYFAARIREIKEI
jgi:hypothetical protein